MIPRTDTGCGEETDHEGLTVLVRILSFALSEIEAISVAFALRSETI